MARYENSLADKAKDRKTAAKIGVTPEQFEGSALDEKMDAAGQAALDRGRANAAGPQMPDHAFAHRRPLS